MGPLYLNLPPQQVPQGRSVVLLAQPAQRFDQHRRGRGDRLDGRHRRLAQRVPGVSWFAFTAVVVILLDSTQLPGRHSELRRADHYRSGERGGIVSTVAVAGGTDSIGRAVAGMPLQRGDQTTFLGRDLVKGAEFLTTAEMAEATDRRDHTKH